MSQTTDETFARARLEMALQVDEVPVLTTAEVDLLMQGATSAGEDGDPDYFTDALLRNAAYTGWRAKAGKVAGHFTVALPDGMKFNREQVLAHCLAMAASFGPGGTASVLGEPVRRSGIGVVGLVSTMVDGEYPA
jgi:hypothetical protein